MIGFAVLGTLTLSIGCGRESDGVKYSTSERAYIAQDTAAEGMERQPEVGVGPGERGDQFSHIIENDFTHVGDAPRSTFSVDVDTASYEKSRTYLEDHHRLPPPDAVRIEEFVNYFSYDYTGPKDGEVFAAHLEVADCPWHEKHRLIRIGIKGREVAVDEKPSNLVFLVDRSGSMDNPNKLPLVQFGLKSLVKNLSGSDRVAIVSYAGSTKVELPSISCDSQTKITQAIDKLSAGGSTAGSAGIDLAYNLALSNFIEGGNNRVILCTDGDFNVGRTSPGDLVRQVEEFSKQNVFMTVLGFGMGNHNDAMLEEISNKGNGNYAFVDSELEARKVLVDQMNSTLIAIAKDVKLQVEFNPVKVASYRLIGYENRMLADQDFTDDKKDAGEVGSGHSVTAIYEVVPRDVSTADGESKPAKEVIAKDSTPLKYQTQRQLSDQAAGDELLALGLRYKQPDAEESTLVEFALQDDEKAFANASIDFQFAAAVAAFGMILRGSEHKGTASYDAVLEMAQASQGDDHYGYRGELIDLVRTAQALQKQRD